jgi:hypothetical protein
MDGSGNFAVTLMDKRNGFNDNDIYAQRYSSNGTALGGNFKVDDKLRYYESSSNRSDPLTNRWHVLISATAKKIVDEDAFLKNIFKTIVWWN